MVPRRFAETPDKGVMNATKVPCMHGVSSAFTNNGLAFDHDRDAFAATWCVHHAFAFLKGG
jgi:hypothetical protein|tara:strand:- start:351 stop:533 length:183 start_codon:yes stop_codon:yes gene_type:complete